MRQRTDRIRLDDTLRLTPPAVEPVRLLSASGEIWVGDRSKDVAVPRPRRLVIVRGMRRYFG